MTREEYLSITYPTSDGTTYIQALDIWMAKLSKESSICPKCAKTLDKDGLCWSCIIERNQ